MELTPTLSGMVSMILKPTGAETLTLLQGYLAENVNGFDLSPPLQS